MALPVRKFIVRLRMWYADLRGHHGKPWNYEPGDHYMGRNKNKKRTSTIKNLVKSRLK